MPSGAFVKGISVISVDVGRHVSKWMGGCVSKDDVVEVCLPEFVYMCSLSCSLSRTHSQSEEAARP